MNPLRLLNGSRSAGEQTEVEDQPRRQKRKASRAKQKKAPRLQHSHELSPFLADHTQSGLNDRFAELRKRRDDWMLAAFCLVVVLALSVGLNIYQSTKARVIPFKVVVHGETGQLLEAGVVEPMSTVEDLYIQRELREILKGLRVVYNDEAATSGSFLKAYGYIAENSPADSYLKDFFSRAGNHPLELIGRAQRSVVEVIGPSPLSGTHTWTMQWVERTALITGEVTEDVYRGSFTINIIPVEDREMAERNPLGIWIDGVQWEKVSSKVIDLTDLEDLSPLDLLYPEDEEQR